jgi:hypothetical protein
MRTPTRGSRQVLSGELSIKNEALEELAEEMERLRLEQVYIVYWSLLLYCLFEQVLISTLTPNANPQTRNLISNS